MILPKEKNSTNELIVRLNKINTRISHLMKNRMSIIDERTQSDISRLRQLRVIVEQEISIRDFKKSG